MRNMSRILARIVKAQAGDRDVADMAQVDREVSNLKLQAQANTGLLYDISYLITSRVRPAYRYQVMNHHLSHICLQIWCLQQALSAMDDGEERKQALAPIITVLEPLDRVFQDLADRVERGAAASAADIAGPVNAVREALQPYRGTIMAQGQSAERPATRYGVDAIGMMIYHLDIFADAMNDNQAAALPRTTELEHLYEATHP